MEVSRIVNEENRNFVERRSSLSIQDVYLVWILPTYICLSSSSSLGTHIFITAQRVYHEMTLMEKE